MSARNSRAHNSHSIGNTERKQTQITREYVQVWGADLVVLGTQGRGAVLEALMGSTAKSILATLPCDALVVRAPRR